MRRSPGARSPEDQIPNQELALVQGIWKWLPVVPDKNGDAFPASQPAPEDPITQTKFTQRELPRPTSSPSLFSTPQRSSGRLRKPLSALKKNIVLPQPIAASELELAQFKLPKQSQDDVSPKRPKLGGDDFDGFVGLERRPVGDHSIRSKPRSATRSTRTPALTLTIPNLPKPGTTNDDSASKPALTSDPFPGRRGFERSMCSLSVEHSVSREPSDQVVVQVCGTPPEGHQTEGGIVRLPVTPRLGPQSICSTPTSLIPTSGQLPPRRRQHRYDDTPSKSRLSTCPGLGLGAYASPKNIHYSMPLRLPSEHPSEDSFDNLFRAANHPQEALSAKSPVPTVTQHIQTLLYSPMITHVSQSSLSPPYEPGTTQKEKDLAARVEPDRLPAPTPAEAMTLFPSPLASSTRLRQYCASPKQNSPRRGLSQPTLGFRYQKPLHRLSSYAELFSATTEDDVFALDQTIHKHPTSCSLPLHFHRADNQTSLFTRDA